MAVLKFFDPPEDEINFDSFIKFSRYSYRLLCFDHEPLTEEATQRKKLRYLVRKVMSIVFLLFIAQGSLSHGGYGIAHLDDLVAALSSMLDVFTSFVALMKGVTAFRRRDDILKLFQEFKEIFLRREGKNKKYGVKKYLNNYHLYIKMYALSSLMVVLPVILLMVPFLWRGEMGTLVKIWFPFNVFTPHIYPVIAIWTDLVAYSIVLYTMANDSMLYCFLTIVAMELDFLKTDLMDLGSLPKHERLKQIKDLAYRHNRLLNIGDTLQDIFSLTIFLTFAVSSLSLCFIAFRLVIVEADITIYALYVPYLGIICGQIFFLCIFGQKLIDSCESVTDGAYFSEWETFDDNKIKKQLILIMCRGQKPKVLTALGFTEISLSTFSAVRKKSSKFNF